MSHDGVDKPRALNELLLGSVVIPTIAIGGAWAVHRWLADEEGSLGFVTSVGLLLVLASLVVRLTSLIQLPHIVGFLLTGVLVGPGVLGLVSHHDAENLGMVNALALTLIALAGGAELRLREIRAHLGSLLLAHTTQTLLVPIVMLAVFLAMRPLIPFAADASLTAAVGMALLWAVFALSRSPSATLAVLAETRGRGALSRHTLAFVMSSDVIVVLLAAATIALVRPLFTPGAELDLGELQNLLREVVGSIAVGVTLGLLLALYLKVVARHLVLVLVGLGFGVNEIIGWLLFEPMLTFLTAGIVVGNIGTQGDRLVHAVERTSEVVFILFFATAGAHLDLGLLAALWPAAAILVVARAVASFAANGLAAKIAGDPPAVRRWGASGMISQAGFSVGLAVIIARSFPDFGVDFQALALATIAMGELMGPIVFRYALGRAGEIEPTRA